MSIAEVKEEIKSLECSELDEVAALILQLRRERNPERKKQLTDLIDSDDWVAWKKDD